MKKNNASFLLFCVFSSFLQAQNTQTYFQQEVNYRINVSLDDKKHELSGEETLEYKNNSPDELTFIWFHIWPNAYKNNNTAMAKQLIASGKKNFYFASASERGNIDRLNFKVNGQAVKTEFHPEHIDIIKVILNEPLKAGSTITITTPFHVKIPIGTFSRLGHIGQQYQITQWYPKPAVYDKYGWHAMPYLDQGEFYSEFGSFDVSITIPKNYVVGATGTLVNGEEETAWLMKNAEETKAIEKYNTRDTATPASASEMKTLHYQASNVHDFAWFADKRYRVLHDEVILPNSKKKVDTWVMYTDYYGEYWKKAIRYVNDAVYYYSLWNGDYPYPHATAVDGALSAGGGMEYPMITVIGATSNDKALDGVIAHEVGHNWFYGILGSNERDHGWMDEGINSFNESRYMKTKYDSVTSGMEGSINGIQVNIGKLLGIPDFDEAKLYDLAYRYFAVKKMDQPCDLHSAEYTKINYGAIMYGKTAMLFSFLQEYLGTELYDKCARSYFDAWKFKHPYPEDIKKVYEEVSGKDLSWFFDNMIKTTDQVDYKLNSLTPIEEQNTSWKVGVQNKGRINSPFSIFAIKDGKIIATQWYDGFEGKKQLAFSIPVDKEQSGVLPFDHIKIDAEQKMPDINRQNNTVKMKGFCKKTEPFNLRMFGLVHNTDKTQLFWAPVLGWNNYNKFMLGAAVYNTLIPEKKLEWVVMPMYGFNGGSLAGGASIHYNIHPNRIFQTIRLGVNAERYGYADEHSSNLNFNKIAPGILFEIRKKHLNNPVKQTINIRHVSVTKEIEVRDNAFISPVYYYDILFNAINDFTYLLDSRRKINPYNISLNIQAGEGFVKSAVTANYEVTFKKKQKGLELRAFAGTFIDNKNLTEGNYFFHSSGATGYHDYLYDYVFLGRSETIGSLSHQFAETEGAMKVYTPLGRSKDWLAALNIKSSLPGKLPVKLFADVSVYRDHDYSTIFLTKKNFLLYDAGIYLPLATDYVEVFIPLFMSKDIRDVFYLNNPDLATPPNGEDPDKYRLKRTVRMIRFTFNIHKLNPFELVRNLNL